VGVLDQGYWSDGLVTAPSDDAMVHDIATMKDLGFTMLRKHIKVEPLRWYYHCDRLGMLVWQDMVNGGGTYSDLVVQAPAVVPVRLKDSRYRRFSRTDETGRTERAWQAARLAAAGRRTE
jgi:beta-galactosidase/beta-glucuronidase